MSEVHQQLESLGPRWTGALGQTECGTFAWFDDDRLPTDTNLQTLAEVREKIDRVRQEMVAAGRSEGLERVDWQLITIDWLLRYDAAALKLRPGGELGRLVAELERAHAAGDATARERAPAAYDALLGAGLREAMQMYPRKMSTMGEFGALATMNVKAYATLLQLIERLRQIDPALPELKPESPVAPNEPPRIVMQSPSSTAKPDEPLTVRAAVLAGQPLRNVAVHYGDEVEFEPSDTNRIAVSYLPPVCDLIGGHPANLHYAVVAVGPRGERSAPARVSLAFTRPALPAPPTGLIAKAGPGKVLLTWTAPAKPLLRFNVYRAEGTTGELRKVAERIRGGIAYQDIGLSAGVVHCYQLRTVDRGGQESAPSEMVSAEPMQRLQEPVFMATFDGDAKATVAQGVRAAVGQGTVVEPAGFTQGIHGQALDVRNGGYVTFPYDSAFDLSGELTLACWVKLDTLSAMPVLVSCGEWEKNGWFLQVLGNRFRFFVGGPNVLDAGAAEPGRWMHVAAVFDGTRMLLYQDGQLVGSREVGPIDYTPWGRPLFVGHYHLLQEQYQVHGLLDDLKLWQRALTAAEIAAEAH